MPPRCRIWTKSCTCTFTSWQVSGRGCCVCICFAHAEPFCLQIGCCRLGHGSRRR
ncbi:hypothetical protein OG21DRAFT_921215 [Imleria badia]|nr:hypothetical protein OG21DRAFT_921215 [Imleria badia]